MDQDGGENQPKGPHHVYYGFIAENVLADDIDRVTEVQRSVLPTIAISLKNAPRGFSAPLGSALKGSPSGREPSHRFDSVLKFSVDWNQKLAFESSDRLHINFSMPSGATPEESRRTTPDLSSAAKVAAIRFAHRQALTPLLEDVVRTIQSESNPSASQANIPVDEWMLVAAEINQLAEAAGASDEEVDSLLEANPGLQEEMDELIQVLDFTDPGQRAKIVKTMKALTYLMFFAVIIGSWHLVAAYAGLISLMGMTAPNVVKAVGNGTEQLLSKISPLSEEEPKD